MTGRGRTRPRVAGLERCLEGIPDDAVVLLDGLVASSVPDLLARHRDRLRHVVLVHMPLGHAGAGEARHTERVALTDARAVLTTSNWTRDWLVATYALAAGLVHVARPGVDDAVRSLGTPTGGALLCVAAVIPAKGQDVLVAALAALADLPWTCTFVGTLERDPAFVAGLVRAARAAGIEDRVHLVGTATRSEVDTHYPTLRPAGAAVTGGDLRDGRGRGAVPRGARRRQRRRGRPGGVRPGGRRRTAGLPGPRRRPGGPGRRPAGRWLADADLRQRWRGAAMSRSARLPGWPATAARVADVLAGVAHVSATMRLLGHPFAGALLGVAVLVGLVWRLGTGPVVHGIASIGAWPLAAAVLIGVPVTVCCALRWSLVSRGLGVALSVPAAVAGCYRAQFLNTALPGGVLGDVSRAVRHGRAAGSPGRAAGAVALERLAGQVVQLVLAAAVLLLVPSPVRAGFRSVAVVLLRRRPGRRPAGARGPAGRGSSAGSGHASTPYALRCWTGAAGRASCSPRWGRWSAASSPSWSPPGRSGSPRRPSGCCRSP